MSTLPATVTADAVQALRAKAAAASCETWRPEPGDTLEGIITGGREVDGPFGRQMQAIIEPFDGSPSLALWLNPWLLAQFQAQCAAIGDLVSVTFHGQGRSARGATYNRYSITVQKV